MNTNEDKHIEKLIDNMMKNQSLETPSFDFTSKVMNQVVTNKKSQAFTYKPLISKQTTLIIICVSIAIITYAIFNHTASPNKSTLSFDYSFIYKNRVTEIFNFSKITTYATVLGTIMLLAQITFLKNHFDHKN